jgi:hypothetical protein
MTIVASSVFRMLQFPHQGKIVTIDQLNYCIPDSNTHNIDNVLLVGDSQLSYESVGVGLLKGFNVYAIIIVLCISIDKSNIRTRSLRNTHSQETQHLSWETL